MRLKHYIYGLVTPDGKCLYVGQTTDRGVRERCHRRYNSKFHELLPWEFKILGVANDPEGGAALEARWINEMKAIGQADYNKIRASYYVSTQQTPTHFCLETGELFYGIGTLCETFKLSRRPSPVFIRKLAKIYNIQYEMIMARIYPDTKPLKGYLFPMGKSIKLMEPSASEEQELMDYLTFIRIRNRRALASDTNRAGGKPRFVGPRAHTL